MKWLLFVAVLCSAADKRVAITIDDLPRGGDGGPRDYEALRQMTAKLLAPFKAEKIPVIGFVNEGSLPARDMLRILDHWTAGGAELGNHTYSHANLFATPLAEFEKDLLRGEVITRAALGRKPEYFRHPFLNTGKDLETKRAFEAFLTEHGYKIAPVTLDSSDYIFAAVYTRPEFRERIAREYVPYLGSIVDFFEQRAKEVVGHEIPQILLIHANQLNADQMPELLAMFRRRSYSFISLEEALKDPAYSLPEEYSGSGGVSWVYRWNAKKLKFKTFEEEAPPWVMKEYEKRAK